MATKTKRLVVLLEPETFAELRRTAIRRGISLGELVRRFIKEGIARPR